MDTAEEKSVDSAPLGCSRSPLGLSLKVGWDPEDKEESHKNNRVFGANVNLSLRLSPRMKIAAIVLIVAVVLAKACHFCCTNEEASRVIHEITKDLQLKNHNAAEAIHHFAESVKLNSHGLQDLAIRLHLQPKLESRRLCNFDFLLNRVGYASMFTAFFITALITVFAKVDRTWHISLVVLSVAVVSAGAFTYRVMKHGMPEFHFNLGWLFVAGAVVGLAILSFRMKKSVSSG